MGDNMNNMNIDDITTAEFNGVETTSDKYGMLTMKWRLELRFNTLDISFKRDIYSEPINIHTTAKFHWLICNRYVFDVVQELIGDIIGVFGNDDRVYVVGNKYHDYDNALTASSVRTLLISSINKMAKNIHSMVRGDKPLEFIQRYARAIYRIERSMLSLSNIKGINDLYSFYENITRILPYIEKDVKTLHGPALAFMYKLIGAISVHEDITFVTDNKVVQIRNLYMDIYNDTIKKYKYMMKLNIIDTVKAFHKLNDIVEAILDACGFHTPVVSVNEYRILQSIEYKLSIGLAQPSLCDLFASFIVKLIKMDPAKFNGCLDEFRSIVNITNKSHHDIRRMLVWLEDGIRIGNRLKADGWDNYKTMNWNNGSLKRMIDDSRFNHSEDNKKKAFDNKAKVKDPTPMPLAPIPDELKQYHLDTYGKMTKAGIDCEQCIGGSADYDSNIYDTCVGIFFRKDNICAEVHVPFKSNEEITIKQCYDHDNSVTPESESFERLIVDQYARFKRDDFSL